MDCLGSLFRALLVASPMIRITDLVVYADSIDELVRRLNEDLRVITEWFKSHGLRSVSGCMSTCVCH